MIEQNLKVVRSRLSRAAFESHRNPSDILLLAVSKGQTIDTIRDAFKLGLKNFGENYLQEAMEKQRHLNHLAIQWHYIGPIQSNKAAIISQRFDWVHSVDRLKIATILNDHRPLDSAELQICIQVNLDTEAGKSGILPHECVNFAKELLSLKRLKLRGLMAIPKPESNKQLQFETFLRLQQLCENLNHSLHLKLDTLSMGMSEDMEAAIAAGSTIIRIGRAIFGKRL